MADDGDILGFSPREHKEVAAWKTYKMTATYYLSPQEIKLNVFIMGKQ